MDIQQWLQDTADREPPEERVETGFPAFLQPQPETADIGQPKRSLRQKRKRVSSASLVPARRSSLQSFSLEHARLAKNTEATSSQRTSGSSSQSQQSPASNARCAPIETFQRRSRHKTRPDRYESKPKRRKDKHNSNRERKHESRRRKSHRSGDGARTTGLVQSFQLKNGPKNQRLTLKPDVSAGIFKNGRASGPVMTSGPGLPDLVFNEMRFLRRPKEHQDELPGGDPKKQSKKSQRQTQEEEISAYFNQSLPPDRQAGHSIPHAAEPQTSERGALQQPVLVQPVIHPSQPPVEFSERPFLGFGSRGPPHNGSGSRRRSNSCYTWSESTPPRRPPLRVSQAIPTFDQPTQERPAHREAEASQVSDTPISKKRADTTWPQQIQSPAEAGRWLRSRRANAPALVEVFQASKPNHHSAMSVAVESSQPLPNFVRLSNEAELEEMNNRWEEASYHTSDILKIHNAHDQRHRSSSPANQRHVGSNRGNDIPATSDPTSERLRRALDGIGRTRAEVPTRAGPRSPHQSREELSGSHISTVLAEQGPPCEHAKVASTPAPWEMPRKGFSRTSDVSRAQQRLHRMLPATARPQSAHQRQACSRTAPPTIERSHDIQEEMLDVLPDAPLIRPQQTYVNVNTREAEALMRRLASRSRNEVAQEEDVHSFEMRIDRDSHPEQGQQLAAEELYEPMSLLPELHPLHSDQLRNTLSGEQFQSERYAVDLGPGEHEELDKSHREMANPELAGFWRPNILY